MENFISFKRIKENDKEATGKVCETLIKIIEKIIEKPNDESKRRLKLDSEEVFENLMPYSGAMEFLFEIGFVENDEDLILPMSVKLETLKECQNKLNTIWKGEPRSNKPCATTLPTNPVPRQAHEKNKKFALKLQNSFEHVLFYEDNLLKRKALSVIPVDRFRADAIQKFEGYKKSQSNELKPYDLNDFILLELLAWFKYEFFKWTNQPECDWCKTKEKMVYRKNSAPHPNEATWLAGNVEVYQCSICEKITRFPRYNHPGKLLETRNGRCGEWANCFCLCLRAMNYEARYVLDWTDHVWCEVFSQSQQRWLHADPCENLLDKPLVYEHGWAKSLSYIIAFSAYECLDVTWRYTNKFREVMKRRSECDENWLVDFTNRLSKTRQAAFDEARRNQIQMRLVTEVVEFLTPKIIKDGEEIGRQSGSLQWRLGRGETKETKEIEPFVFKLESIDLEKNVFQMEYNTVSDAYTVSNRSEESFNGWSRCLFDYKNMQYKLESDWRMCYLARANNTDLAFVEWCFDLTRLKGQSKKLRKIEVKCEGKCFENGKIEWSLFWLNDEANFNEKNKLILSHEETKQRNLFDLKKSEDNVFLLQNFDEFDLSKIKLRADLSLGKGDCAWQHTQLFRQSLNDKNVSLLSVKFYF